MRSFFLVIMLVIYSTAQAQSVPTLAQQGVELDAKQSLPLANEISFKLTLSKAEEAAKALLNWKNITVEHIASDSLTVSITGQPYFLGDVRDQYSSNSFIIDIEEESVKQFVAGFTKDTEQPLTLKDLEKYVDGYIQEPTYINGFKIASVVANQRSGDCSEYAVLITALARSLGLPSRVVLGTVIFEATGQVTAFGHAWSEVWFNDRWHIVDAALYEADTLQTFYLPAGVLENEGPGFALSLFSVVSRFPKKISHLQNL